MSQGISIPIGEKVPLHMQLYNGDTGKFVRAFVKNDSGIDVIGSPFTLNHVGNGLYTNGALSMPDVPFVESTYQVFDDSGFTAKAPTHGDDVDIFNKDPDAVPGPGLPESDAMAIEVVVDQEETVIESEDNSVEIITATPEEVELDIQSEEVSLESVEEDHNTVEVE